MPRELLNELLLAAALPSPMPPEVESSEPFTNVVNDEHPALASEPVAIIEGASDAIHPSTDAVYVSSCYRPIFVIRVKGNDRPLFPELRRSRKSRIANSWASARC